MTAPKNDRQSARRALSLLFILSGRSWEGVRLKDAAAALKTSSPNALRDLQMLGEEGIAERIPGRDDCWRLTPKIVQVSRAHAEEIARAAHRLAEFEQRYSREP